MLVVWLVVWPVALAGGLVDYTHLVLNHRRQLPKALYRRDIHCQVQTFFPSQIDTCMHSLFCTRPDVSSLVHEVTFAAACLGSGLCVHVSMCVRVCVCVL